MSTAVLPSSIQYRVVTGEPVVVKTGSPKGFTAKTVTNSDLEDVSQMPRNIQSQYSMRADLLKAAGVVSLIGLVALGVYSEVIELPTKESVQAVASKLFDAMSSAAEVIKTAAVDLTNWFFSTAYPVIEDAAIKISAFAQEYFVIGFQMASDALAVAADWVGRTVVWLKDEAISYLNRV